MKLSEETKREEEFLLEKLNNLKIKREIKSEESEETESEEEESKEKGSESECEEEEPIPNKNSSKSKRPKPIVENHQQLIGRVTKSI